MIPIGDDVPSRRFPIITAALIIVNVAVFFYELSLADGLSSFVGANAVVPKSVLAAVGGGGAKAVISDFFTAQFLHIGWLHIGGNMLYLWVFGDNVEDRFGRPRFLLFYFTSGFVAMFAHVLSMPESIQPAVGASGAVAGVLGAYLVMFPRARVFILIPLFVIFPVIAVPALFVLSFWFLEQLFYGAGVIVFESGAAAGVAWWAHIGGFAAGMLMAGIISRARGPYSMRW